MAEQNKPNVPDDAAQLPPHWQQFYEAVREALLNLRS